MGSAGLSDRRLVHRGKALSRKLRVRSIKLPNLPLRVSERRLLLLLMDVLLLNAALVGGLWLRHTFLAPGQPTTILFKWVVTLTLVWMAAGSFFDCYDLARAASTTHSLRSSLSAVLVTMGAYALIPVVTPPLTSRGFIFFTTALALAGIAVWRFTYARLFEQPWFGQRALIVGAGWAGRTLVEALRSAPADDANPYRGTGYQPVGFVDDAPTLQGTDVAGLPVLGTADDLVTLAQALQVDEIVLAITHRHAIRTGLFDALLRCRELGFRLTTMAVLYERLLGRVPVDHIGHDLAMVVPMGDTAHERAYQVLKRLFDLGCALLGLVALGGLIPIVALCNGLTSPGPLFYRQRRVGRGGRIFEVIKFRSMVPNAEEKTGAVWADRDDDRITFIGRLLRRTRLDELPQVINVLRGEMSVIGPRPERPEFVEELAQVLPFYRARHAVRPGITGWAQVEYEYGNSVDDARVKLEYDLYYVKHAGVLLDTRILLKTLPVMLSMRGM